MIEINNLTKYYGFEQVLNAIYLTFKEGSIYGIVGANGAGKTTLFKCMTGIEIYKGEIFYDGGILKNVLGFLQTEPYFFSKITGYEYLKLLCNARQISLNNVEEKNIFDLPLNRYASNYSTGMKKKLALTGILLQKNEVFLLDEPFNGVDLQSNIIIKEIILKLKEKGKTVIISSHIFSILRETCDILHLIKDGEISKTKNSFDEIETEMLEFERKNKFQQIDLLVDY